MFFKKYKKQNRERLALLFCFLVIFQSKSSSQSITNLVPNNSAELYTSCPNSGGQVYKATFWYLPTGTAGSTDYYQACATFTGVGVPSNSGGFQNPKTGNAYFGFALYGIVISGIEYREYLGNGLNYKLKNGKTYCVTYYVSLAEFSRYGCNKIGVKFSQDSILNITPYPPQPLVLVPDFENSNIIIDTLNWSMVQGQYIANGTERFITLGNFRTDLNTNSIQVKPLNLPSNQTCAYYYIDDISVVEINSSNAHIKDTLIICPNDSLVLGTDSTEFATYTWQSTAAGLAALSCTNCPNPIAKPLVTTKYYLTKVQCSATTQDSVVVVVQTPTTIANAGTNQLICEGDAIQIGTNDSTFFTNYSWLPTSGLSCNNCAMPYASPQQTTIYNLTRNECNVSTTSSVKVTIDDCNPTYTVPNVFTPNYDGINDTWGVTFSSTKYIKNFQLQIYNRWGLLMFQSNSGVSTPNIKWDGHTNAGIDCTNGVYYYIITFTKNEEPIQLKGYVSLFR